MLRNLLRAPAVATIVALIIVSGAPSVGGNQIVKDDKGETFMEEIPPWQDSLVTWQSMLAAYKCVGNRQLGMADRWIMYAELKSPIELLVKMRDNPSYLAGGLTGIAQSEKLGAVSEKSCDLRLLHALLQMRLHRNDEALQSLKLIARDFPTYAGINQLKARIAILEGTDALDVTNFNCVEQRSGTQLRWKPNKFPLKVHIPTDAEARAVRGYVAGDSAVMIAAFATWQSQGAGTAKFRFVPSAAQADIDCIWVGDPSKFRSKEVLGTCEQSPDSTGSMQHATIRILTFNPELYRSISIDHDWRRDSLLEVCLHEIGHGLGLGHSANSADVMYYMAHERPVKTISEIDVEALKSLILSNAREFYSAGVELQNSGQHHSALQQFEKALAMAPNDFLARSALCTCLSRMAAEELNSSRVAEAINHLVRAQSLMTDKMPAKLRINILDNLQYAFAKSGKAKEAAQVQKQLDAIKILPPPDAVKF